MTPEHLTYRKPLLALSWALVAAAVVWLGASVFRQPPGDEAAIEDLAPRATLYGESTTTVNAAGPGAARHNEFPSLAVGTERPIDFLMDESMASLLTPREQADQLRDWLLFAVVSDAGLSAEEYNRVLFDVPALRHSYVRPIANFEYGKTRSCVTGDGVAVTIIPKSPEDQRRDFIAAAADEYRQSRGEKPTRICVFQYELAPENRHAVVERLPDVSGDETFTAAYGYHEQNVETIADLEAFMTAVQDVTYVAKPSSGLLLGGRKLLGREYRNIRTEDVAAVFKAQAKLSRDRETLETRFKTDSDALDAEWQAKLDSLNGRKQRGEFDSPRLDPSSIVQTPEPPPWTMPTDPAPANRDPFVRDAFGRDAFGRDAFGNPSLTDILREAGVDPDEWGIPGEDDATSTPETTPPAFTPPAYTPPPTPRFISYEGEFQKLQDGYNEAAKELLARQQAEMAKLGLVEGTGFSLDPSYDFEGAAAWFREDASPLLHGIAAKDDSPITTQQIEEAAEALDNRNEVPALVIFDELAQNEGYSLAGEILSVGFSGFRFQAARYDGDLQGTEVGMNLFYTDLLAKLWVSVNYGAPKEFVPDFPTGPDGGIAPIYRQETIEQPSTRLWFGPDDRGFQKLDGNQTLCFARRATRIFAASSNPLTPGDEVPASHQAERRMGWWNDHFEEVAEYEPEYERLNEYMKWSLIIGWLFATDADDRLEFLSDVTVDHSAWFADWVKQRPDLKFTQWDKVEFYPRDYKGTKTEAIPILVSDTFANFGEDEANWTISGGVSGGEPSAMRRRPSLPKELTSAQKLSLRGVELAELDAGALRLRTYSGATHTFEPSTLRQATMVSAPKEGSQLRSTYGQLKPTNFERTARMADGSVRLDTSAGGAQLGSLEIAPRGNGFEVAYRSLEVDQGCALARELSRVDDAAAFLRGDPRVEAFVNVADGEFLVKTKSSDKWTRFAATGEPPSVVPDGWQARAADNGAGAKSYNVAWVEPAEVAPSLQSSEWVRIDLGTNTRQAPHIEPLPRGPPPEAAPLEVRAGDARFSAAMSPDGQTVYLRGQDLPPAVVESPESLVRSLRGRRIADGGSLDLGDPLQFAPERSPLIRALESGDSREAVRLVLEDPAGARSLVEADVARRANRADDFLAGSRLPEAIVELETALRVHPKNSRLLARLGLAEGRAGRPRRFVDFLNRDVHRTELGTLMDEVNFRLQQPELLPGDAQNLLLQSRMGAGREITRQNPATSVRAIELDGKAAIEADFTSAPATRPAESGSLPPKARLYVDDAAQLSNRDWSPGGREVTLQEAIAGGEVELLHLYDPQPALAIAPDVIQIPGAGGQTRARLVGAEEPSARTRVHYRAQAGQPGQYCESEDEEDLYFDVIPAADNGASDAEDCVTPPVYLVRKKAA